MKRRLFFIFATGLLFCFIKSQSSLALTFEQLPLKESSSQWEIVLDKEKYNSAPKDSSKYQTYSFVIKNIGEDQSNVTIQSYRNSLNSKTKYALFNKAVNTSIPKGQEFTQKNFFIDNKATNLEIEVSWTVNNRPVKETFIFN